MKQKGFTLIELIIALGLITIMTAVAVPNIIKYYRTYVFNDYVSQIEYMLKQAKIYAMENSSNIGICVHNKKVTAFNIGYDRGAHICNDTSTFCTSNNHNAPCVINKTEISEDYINVMGSNLGSVVKTDPRGIAIYPFNGGNICLSYGENYAKIIIGRTFIRLENGSGGCQ